MYSRRGVKRAAWDMTRPGGGRLPLPPWLGCLLLIALAAACACVSIVIVPILQGLG